MVRISLQFKANLENITNIRPEGDDFRWYLKVKCLNCGEETKQWVYLCAMNITVQYLIEFPSFTVDIVKDSAKEYTADDSNQFKTMVTFDCRGVEPTAFSPRTGFVAEGAETTSKFTDINLSDLDWSDYDEKAEASVGIYEVTSQFIKAHS
ncbi:UPF0587 protein [Exaiptasia diaphana]|nr:UPF0587 protein [Exaiptasia diaphana]